MGTELSTESRLRISDEVLFQELQGEAVLLNLKTGVYFGLDPVGTRIWGFLGQAGPLERIVASMLEIFDTTEEQCRTDLLKFVAQLQENGLVSVME